MAPSATKRSTKPRARQTLIILGASGDLTGRLLLPGIGSLLASPRGSSLKLIGAGRDPWSQAQWRKRVKESFGTVGASGPLVQQAQADTEYHECDVTHPDDLGGLLARAEGQVSIFFALPPAVTVLACHALSAIGLPRRSRLVLEKPFGVDADSADELNDLLIRLVPERNIFRVDHFLGKSTVLNLLGLRFANRMIEPVLNRDQVAKIEIIFDEDLGLESRAGYYDTAGALRDMIQSHLLQVLSLLVMEPPPTLKADDLRDRKADILRATRIWGDDPVASSRRARYTAGTIGRRKLRSYASEAGVDGTRKTETLAEILVEVNTWRWAGVPILLRSGKALGAKRKEAVITFQRPPKLPQGFTGSDVPQQLRIGFGPDCMMLTMNINGPGDPFELGAIDLTADFGPGALSPYGEVLAGVLEGEPSLSVRGDSAVDSWKIVQPVLDAWAADRVPLDTYRAGSDGPRAWRKPLGE